MKKPFSPQRWESFIGLQIYRYLIKMLYNITENLKIQKPFCYAKTKRG